MRRACQAPDGLILADFTGFGGTEQGKEFVELHLTDLYIMEEIAREDRGWSATSTSQASTVLGST